MVMLVLTEMKLMHGDELRIRYVGELHKAWSGVGHVIKIPDSILWLGFALLLLVFLILFLFLSTGVKVLRQ